MQIDRKMIWQVFGASIQGANHRRQLLPNQDAISWTPSWSGLGPALVLAVSDGHGSPRSFRSHLGSALAVRLARYEAARFLRSIRFTPEPDDKLDLQSLKEWTEQLPHRLVERWQTAVRAHIYECPFTTAELGPLSERDGEAGLQALVENSYLAYGATLLIALALPGANAYLQLGDGDILAVSPGGDVQRPLPADERLFANATTSLCLPSAERDFRCVVQEAGLDGPALILLASDGYANSYRDEVGFLQVGSDLLEMLQSAGLPAVRAQLPAWLTEISQAGSGDDISLGVFCRLEMIGAGTI